MNAQEAQEFRKRFDSMFPPAMLAQRKRQLTPAQYADKEYTELLAENLGLKLKLARKKNLLDVLKSLLAK